MTRIALLGLGAMGQRLGLRLLAAGHTLTVWNRSADKADMLVEAGARRGPSPREAARGQEVVWSMVYDDQASRRVWLDPVDGAAAALQPGMIAIESSTLSAAWIGELHSALTASQAAFVDAPVAGSRLQADAGQLVFMVGGAADVVAHLRPILAAAGSAAHHIGPVGAGTWLKLAVNTLFATQVATVAELLGLLSRAGLDVPRAVEALRAMPVTSPAAAGAAMLMLAGNYAPQAPVDLIAKDLHYALMSAKQCGADMPLASSVHARYAAAQAAGYGSENLVAVAKLYS